MSLFKRRVKRTVVPAHIQADGRLTTLLTVYGVLHSRYESNTTLQWQIPIYVIPAEGVLLVGLLSTSSDIVRRFLGVIALALGFLGCVVMRRIELTARWDRQYLDVFEDELLKEEPQFKLLHDQSFPARLRARPLSSAHSFIRKADLAFMHLAPAGSVVMLMMALLGSLVAVLGLTHLAPLPTSPPPRPVPSTSQSPSPLPHASSS
jgi:hypothetical protein